MTPHDIKDALRAVYEMALRCEDDFSRTAGYEYYVPRIKKAFTVLNAHHPVEMGQVIVEDVMREHGEPEASA